MAKRKHRVLDYYARKTLRGNDEILVAAWDVETDDLGGKLLSIQYGVRPAEVVVDTAPGMVERFIAFILDYPSPYVWFAHFSEYDWRYIMDYLVTHQMDFEISMRNETNVYQITIRYDGKKIIMRDSYALWNSPLEKLAKSFCPEIPKLDLDFATTRFDPNNAEHLKYAERDVQILLVGLPRLNAMLNKHFGVNPNATFASTSLKGWQSTLANDEIYSASKYDEREAFVRLAYYGGLVFLTSTNTQTDCETYDINSSYPYAMMKYGVPYGSCATSSNYLDSRMGIYRVRVKAPDNLVVPILPGRDDKGNMRWYRGEFDTVVTNRELVFAANNGYEILKIYEGIVWEETAYPFTPFIEKCKTIRKQFAAPAGGTMTAEEYLAKFMQNSLYGKFGTRRERFRLMATHTMEKDDAGNPIIGDAEPWDKDGNWYVVRQEIDKDMRCLPAWAVFITAHARLRLLQAVYSVGVENVIYGDTDSITIKSGEHTALIDSGAEYGQWKLEKQWAEFRAIAPKVYSGVLTNGERKGAAKGVPKKNLTDTHWRELLEDGSTTAQARSLASLKVALRTGIKPAHTLMRRSSSLTNSVNFISLPDGTVRAKMAA